jgi:hypothetical protein
MLDDYEYGRYLLLAVDAWRYGPRDDRAQVDLQNFLADGVRAAARRAGLDDSAWKTQPQGDGLLALLPDSGSEPVLVDGFVRELDTWLARHNHERVPEAKLRLRVAIHSGPAVDAANGFGGRAVVHVCRLRDSKPVRAALNAASGANLVLAVSDPFFDDVIRQRHTSLSAGDFTRAEVVDDAKDFAAAVWIRVPGAPSTRDDATVVSLRFLVPPADFPGFVETVLRPAFTAADITLPAGTSFDDPVRLPGVEVQPVLGLWVADLDDRIREHAPDVRVVVGVCGTVDHARELASSDTAARVLGGPRGGRVVVVIPDHVHETITANAGRLVRPEAYARVGTASWLRVPGLAKPPRPAEHAPEPATSAPAPGSVTAHGKNATAIGSGTFDSFVVGTVHHHHGTER